MMPVLFTSAADMMSSEDFDREWNDVMRSWIPTIDQLRSLGDLDIEWLSSQALPADASDEEFVVAVKRRNAAGLEHGRRMGWWTDYNLSGPATPPIHVNASDFQDQTMAHVMAHVGFFPSVSQARKNGWDRPIEVGIHRVGKNRVVEIS